MWHGPRRTSQLLLAKADVEFAHFSPYLLHVHLFGASFSATWGLSNHPCCRERRHFSSYWACCPHPLPVDSGKYIVTRIKTVPFLWVSLFHFLGYGFRSYFHPQPGDRHRRHFYSIKG